MWLTAALHMASALLGLAAGLGCWVRGYTSVKEGKTTLTALLGYNRYGGGDMRKLGD